MKRRRKTGCRKNHLLFAPNRHCARCRFIHQYSFLLYPDAKHLPSSSKIRLSWKLLIGYSPARVARPYQVLTLGWTPLLAISLCLVAQRIRHSYTGALIYCFHNWKSSFWPAVSVGVFLFIIVSVINILAIRRKILSIWMHKSWCLQYGWSPSMDNIPSPLRIWIDKLLTIGYKHLFLRRKTSSYPGSNL